MNMRTMWRRDEGVGLILVVGIAALVFGLAFTAVAMASSALTQSRLRSSFELALVSAEDGIDVTLARLQLAYDEQNDDFPVPGTQTGSQCVASEISLPTPQESAFASATAERDWAKAQLSNLAATNPECIEQTDSGEYLVIKPATPPDASGEYQGFGRVYSMGWSPSRDAAEAKQRLIKVEYIFLPYSPSHAILTSADLDLSSSTLVTTASGFAPSLAQVHTNGVITTSGNPTVYGVVSSTQESSASSNRFYANTSGGGVEQRPTVGIPRVSATSFYYHARNNDAAAVTRAGWWRDLCPDGVVRPYSNDGPCTSTTAYEGLTGVTYSASDHEWIINRNASSGVYFAHESNVDVGTGNSSFANMTVIASSQNPGDCSTKRYGSISWDHYELQAPAFNNLFLYADADLVTHSNFTAGNDGTDGSAVQSGMFVAGDQIQMETSSQGAVGSVLAADLCNPDPAVDNFSDPITTNQVKNPSVYFDPDANAPFTSIINQTLWLEYTG